MKVRSKEGPSHLCSSPLAFGERSGRRKRGVEPSLGRCRPPVRSMKRSLPRREGARKGPTGSRAWVEWAKATEGVKSLEAQHRRTLQRRGSGTVGQPSWEQERPVSAPAVRPRGRASPRGGLGATNPISGVPDEVGESGAGVGGGHSSEEGVDRITRRSEGPLAERAAQRGGSGIAGGYSPAEPCLGGTAALGARPTPVAGRNATRRLLGGEPCAGEPHARFCEGGLGNGASLPRQSPTQPRVFSDGVRLPREGPYPVRKRRASRHGGLFAREADNPFPSRRIRPKARNAVSTTMR